MECQKIKKISPKLMLTQQTLETGMFQFLPWLQIEYLVDALHNQYMDIW